MRVNRGRAGVAILLVAVVGISLWLTLELRDDSRRLVSIQKLPDFGDLCLPESGGIDADLAAGLEASGLFVPFPPMRSVYAASAAAEVGGTTELTRSPLRALLDRDPAYVAVAINHHTDEVFLQDSNTWSIRVFHRLDNTPPGAERTEPKRVIMGPTSGIQFNSHLYIDPKNGDVFTVENDTGDSIIVFSKDAGGDAAPLRELKVGHRAYAIAVDEEKQEMYVSVQSPPHVEVYRKTASGDEKPLRILQGKNTRLSDSHGIAIDPKNKLLFVNSWGSVSRVSGPDSTGAAADGGRFELPSIEVFSLDASGDAVPLRVIQGPKTQLNWPATMSLDPETGDLYVANDMGQSILVFRGTASGDTAPARVLKGRRTGLSYPVGVTIDTKNQELWVANFGNASATVYPLKASGDVAPLRTVRSAPRDKVALKLGKLNTLAYDSKREEILVPN